MEWKVLKTAPSSAEENMQFDRVLLDSLDPKGEPILHFYDWKYRSLTFGYFIQPEKLLNPSEMKEFDIARRPTGGGIIFHLWDLAFSLLIPSGSPCFFLNPLENYRWVNQVVKESIGQFLNLKEESVDLLVEPTFGDEEREGRSFFCMARPTQYDVLFRGRKVAGAAQRRKKEGFLHQGSISLIEPEEEVLTSLLLSTEIKEEMIKTTFPLLKERAHLREGRREMEQLLKKNFLAL